MDKITQVGAVGTLMLLCLLPSNICKAVIACVIDYRLLIVIIFFHFSPLSCTLCSRGNHGDYVLYNDIQASSAHASSAFIFGMCWLIQIHTQTNTTCISVHCALLSTACEDHCLTALCVVAAAQILSGWASVHRRCADWIVSVKQSQRRAEYFSN